MLFSLFFFFNVCVQIKAWNNYCNTTNNYKFPFWVLWKRAKFINRMVLICSHEIGKFRQGKVLSLLSTWEYIFNVWKYTMYYILFVWLLWNRVVHRDNHSFWQTSVLIWGQQLWIHLEFYMPTSSNYLVSCTQVIWN